ncbi:GAT domain-containing protein [Pleurostoma richardsiae]|uniref:GAT domain-containing protein n=1 Tax=Pleurostoma richardsiae TaxID=41990 RepID=A0AA38S959_9PEZI|nr:GAT domain-containing protein [Pleurostoma richardsiae]
MKAMKGLSMNKMLGSIKRRPTAGGAGSGHDDASTDPQGDTPEAIAARNVRAFCESGGPNNAGDEVTFLPAIVDAAESSPAAAAECARIIRKTLHRDYWTKPSYQYNAIMLMRILADNPGETFTRNLDKKFADTAKELLKSGRDLSVRQMLMETLDSLEATRSYDEGLAPLLEMWKQQKDKAYKAYGAKSNRPSAPPPGPRTLNAPPFDPHSQNYFARSHHNKRLPDPVELSNRLEEARTSAKLLQQVVSCTAPAEVLDNELIREFADRCLSASRSIQGYMTAENPSPDNDTMESLIDTNEQLQHALSQHQRAVLNARKHLGLGERSQSGSPAPPEVNGSTRPDGSALQPPPPLPGRKPVGGASGKGKEAAADDLAPPSAQAGPSRSASRSPRPAAEDAEDPFRDPHPESRAAGAAEPQRLAFEPYHPGFGATPSYVNRQDSALDKVHMHGAGGAAGEEAGENASGYRGSNGVGRGGAAGGSSGSRGDDEDLYDDENGYDSASKSKQPMYRY